MESQLYNSALNRCVYIDEKGVVFNHYTHAQAIGNLRDQNLKDIISHKNLLVMWDLNNDKIEVCRNCSFRYFCDNPSEIVNLKNRSYKKNYCIEPYLTIKDH